LRAVAWRWARLRPARVMIAVYLAELTDIAQIAAPIPRSDEP
jgi:hypothetical protein